MSKRGTVELPVQLVRRVMSLSEELEKWAWGANPRFLAEMRRARREDRLGHGRSQEEVKARFQTR